MKAGLKMGLDVSLLKRVAGSTENYRVQVDCQLGGKLFDINFNVESKKTETWNVNPDFSEHDARSNWNLWNWDVVEVFLQWRTNKADVAASYWEFQLSPINQALLLKIIRPRVQYYIPLQSFGSFRSELQQKSWNARFSLPWNRICPGSSGDLYGNFYSCLGNASQREYFSLFPVREAPMDFHAPELFEQIQV